VSYANYQDRLAANRRWKRVNRARLLRRARGVELVVLYNPAGNPVGWLLDRRV
jgi:hypothetical protein